MRETTSIACYALNNDDREILVMEFYDDDPCADEEVILGAKALCSMQDTEMAFAYTRKLFQEFPVERAFFMATPDMAYITYIGELDHDDTMKVLNGE